MELLRRCAFENGEDLENNVTGNVMGGMGIDLENDKSVCSLFNSEELYKGMKLYGPRCFIAPLQLSGDHDDIG